MISKFVQGPRSLAPSLVRYCTSFRPIPGLEDECGGPRDSDKVPGIQTETSQRLTRPRYFVPPNPFPRPIVDKYGRPKKVFDAIESMIKLGNNEIGKYGYLFSELLGLPNPPKTSTELGGKFAVKLLEYEMYGRVLTAIAWIKWDEEPKSMDDFEMKSWRAIMHNLPSVVRDGLTEKEAKQIIAKIEAAGGKAVMEETLE